MLGSPVLSSSQDVMDSDEDIADHEGAVKREDSANQLLDREKEQPRKRKIVTLPISGKVQFSFICQISIII